MITLEKGSIFDTSCDTLINPTCCCGKMGRGISFEFRERYPDMYLDYSKKTRKGRIRLGVPDFYRTTTGVTIVNLPVRDYWNTEYSLPALALGLSRIKKVYTKLGIKRIAIPNLTPHDGTYARKAIEEVVYRVLKDLPIPVSLYGYATQPERTRIGST